MNVQMAFNLFLVDRESYCSDKSILYYRENILKFMNFLSDRIGSAPDLIECDAISGSWCLHTSPSSVGLVARILRLILIFVRQRYF